MARFERTNQPMLPPMFYEPKIVLCVLLETVKSGSEVFL